MKIEFEIHSEGVCCQLHSTHHVPATASPATVGRRIDALVAASPELSDCARLGILEAAVYESIGADHWRFVRRVQPKNREAR